MKVLERTKREIELKAEKMNDFLRMEYLESCLGKFVNSETLRYCYSELSRLYEKKHMYTDSIKYLEKFQELCLTQKEKYDSYLKEIELLIKAGLYDRVDFAYNKIKEIILPREKDEVIKKMIIMFKEEAEKQEKSNRYRMAAKAYEKLLRIEKGIDAIEIKRKLALMYKKLCMIRESIELERELAREGYSTY
ncbi:MAG: hypothetical protein QXW97_02180 [Candidatus Pacearchaeota archaeon]